MTPHWTLDELIDRIYGIRDEDEHLASCRECSTRLEQLSLRRDTPAPAFTSAELAAQRSAVLDRAASPSRVGWIPAVTAAAALLAVAIFVHHTAPVAPQLEESTALSDAQLFADVYNIEESAEPLAAAPIHELFQDAGGIGQGLTGGAGQ